MRATWRRQAEELSAQFGVTVRWCPLGFEVPDGQGGITHVSSPDAVRMELRGRSGR
jgi:hypothetical protein